MRRIWLVPVFRPLFSETENKTKIARSYKHTSIEIIKTVENSVLLDKHKTL